MYRTTFTVVILSEAALPETLELSEALAEADTGDYVGTYTVVAREKLTTAQMAQALLDAGSDPEFFGLDVDGTDAPGA
jgi:hypothetical protein